MAISRGAGTEIIRTVHYHYDAGNTTAQTLIFGVKHHIYTVLSIVCFADYASSSQNDGLQVYLTGLDASDGTSGQNIFLFNVGATSGQQTFVWNDKFSFNGNEATGFSGGLSTIAEQDAIADQGSNTAQNLFCQKGHANDKWMVTCTYIDQNNE
tara:strand:+ start:288 stop:749 length:462 start_codon:yes stop_codon:yes gene_type:complete